MGHKVRHRNETINLNAFFDVSLWIRIKGTLFNDGSTLDKMVNMCQLQMSIDEMTLMLAMW